MSCPNKNCAVTARFQPISRMAKNLLERLSSEVVSYESYDAHQLKHHYCSYCSKNLPSWLDIRTHYYLTCPKYVVNCDNCEFIFDRADYIQHDCLTHYDIRRLEIDRSRSNERLFATICTIP
mgnify:CR=1 FL=1